MLKHRPYCAQIRSQGSRGRICPHRLAVPEKIFALLACSIFSTATGAPPRCIRHWRRSAPHPLPLPRCGGGEQGGGKCCRRLPLERICAQYGFGFFAPEKSKSVSSTAKRQRGLQRGKLGSPLPCFASFCRSKRKAPAASGVNYAFAKGSTPPIGDHKLSPAGQAHSLGLCKRPRPAGRRKQCKDAMTNRHNMSEKKGV